MGPPDLPLLMARSAEAYTGATVDISRIVIRDPSLAEVTVFVRVVGPFILGLPTRETRRDDLGRDVPGVGGFAHPSSVPDAIAAGYRHHPGCRSDPYVAALLGAARRHTDAPANARMPVFFPVPSALRPAIETSARPQAPSSEPDKKNNAALDKPKDQHGVSIKEDKETTKAQDKQLERDNALNPDNRVAKPETADVKNASLHARYVEVRSGLERANQTLNDRELATTPRSTQQNDPSNREPARDPASRALEQKLVDQTLRLDSASREFFSKPGWQREAAFQRALVLSMFATGQPLEQAIKELGALFSGRGMVDVEQLSKLTNAYGLNELNAVLSETRVSPEVAAQRDAERLAQMQKLKGGRLPEEMLLQQQQAREATGKKSKRGTADDRIDGIDRDPRGGHQQDQREQEAEEALIADDEATNPGFVLKI